MADSYEELRIAAFRKRIFERIATVVLEAR